MSHEHARKHLDDHLLRVQHEVFEDAVFDLLGEDLAGGEGDHLAVVLLDLASTGGSREF